MKKICFLINSLRKGGAEKILTNISNHAAQNKYNVTICIFQEGVHYDLNKNVNIVHIKLFRNFFSILKKFKSLIKKNTNQEIIISNLNFSNYLNIFLSFFIKHKPVVVLHFSLKYYFYSSKSNKMFMFPLHFTLQYILYRFAYKIIAVSDDIRDYYKENMNLNPILIYNPSFNLKNNFISKFNPLNKKKINIIQVGSFINIKNHIELLKCLKLSLCEFCRHNDVSFTFIGSGPLKNKLRDFVIKNKIDDLVTFVGLVDDIGDFYYNSDFLISSSKLEGLPTVIIESLSYSKPVISTFQKSAYEIMSKNLNDYKKDKDNIKNNFLVLDTGIMYQQGNIEQLSNSIIYMIKNLKKSEISINKRNNVLSKFDINNFRKYEKINK